MSYGKNTGGNTMEVPEIPFLHDLSPSASALSGSNNKWVSSFGTSCLRPNPRNARTSDTRWTLGDISGVDET